MFLENLAEIDLEKLYRGHYEAERLPKDFSPERIVPDFAFNILNSRGMLYRPVVDEDYLVKGGAKPLWPEGKPFAVCLTHDVDLVSLYSFGQTVRLHTQNFMSSASVKRKVRSLISFGIDVAQVTRQANAQDPLHCYERWLQVEEKAGARSTFFFWPGWTSVSKHHESDCLYDMEDVIVFGGQRCTVAEMIREIDRRGWEIGLHPSWYSYDNVDELKRQKEALEKVLGHNILSVRQHFLHYDIRVTPRIQTEAGFQYDSTLGFNDNVGFRFGTCYPWNLYDLQAKVELPIKEIPLIIQDGALLNPVKGMRLDEETAFQYVMQLTDAVECVGGLLTILWHTNAVMNPQWWHLYLRIIENFKARNAWFTLVQQACG